MTVRPVAIALLLGVALFAGYFVGSKSGNCRYEVTKQAEFIHLGRHSVVILSADTVAQMFGPQAHELSLFYGSNRMLTESGQRAIVRAPLIAMPRSVRALFFSGDDWTDLVVPVHALETREQVLLRINLETRLIEVGERRNLAQVTHSVRGDGTLVLQP